MRYLMIVKATEMSERGEFPPDAEKMFAEMAAFNNEMIEAGVMLDAAGLKPSSAGKRVRFDGSSRTVIDGPFAETKELVAGYWVWNVKSMDEAVEWLKRCPNPHNEAGEVEIRPMFEAADFGENFTPELRDREQKLMAEIEARNKK
jgi:hypothetical protein